MLNGINADIIQALVSKYIDIDDLSIHFYDSLS